MPIKAGGVVVREAHGIERGTKTVGTVIRVWIASLSFGAAAVHVAVIGGHFREFWLFGLFFVIVATVQVLWGVLVLVHPSGRIYALGTLGTSLLVLVWVASRTVGVPIGPEAGSPEQVGVLDSVATGFEVLIVAGALILTRTRLARLTLSSSAAVMASAGGALAIGFATTASFVAAFSRSRGAGGQLASIRGFTPHLIHFVLLFGALIFLAAYAFVTRPKDEQPATPSDQSGISADASERTLEDAGQTKRA
jgi:hypothetical protein